MDHPEHVIESRICPHCQSSFDITAIDRDFLTRLAPTIAGKKFELPFPTHCPKCRKIRRYAWRNEHKLYKRHCDATGKDIISLFSPDAPCPVYASDYWYSDHWDEKKYGKDFDFSRSFFEQWGELKKIVPMPGKAISKTMENSEYSDNCSELRNCYLVFNAAECEDCLYANDLWGCVHCIDSLCILDCQNCYELLNSRNCFSTHFSYDVKDCRDSFFLYDCEGCQNCYGCYGLVNQEYHIFNNQYGEEEYRQALLKLRNLSIDEQKSQVREFLRSAGYTIKLPENVGSNGIVESTEVLNSRNVSHSSAIRSSEDIRYSRGAYDTRLAMDYDIWGDATDKVYESHQVGESLSSVYFSVCCWANVNHLYYSAYCVNNVHHCFGCIGLQNASYCILNKQYSKEEYEEIVAKIIEKMEKDGEWGEFFPAKYSHFGYNQTMNMDVFPLSREEAISQGFHWSDYESPFPKVEKTIPAARLPENIEEIPDDVLNWAIECEASKKPFRIVKSELEFYRKHHLPIPRRHPDERYRERTKIYINY